MTRTSLFLIICTVLFLLGDLYTTETSGAINGLPVIVDAAGNDLMNNEVKLNEGESKTYTCKHDTGRIVWEKRLENDDEWKYYSYGKRLTIRGHMTLNNLQFRCFSSIGHSLKTSVNVLKVTVIPKPKTTPANPTGAAGSWSRVNDTTVHMIYNYDVKTTVTCKCGDDDAIHAIRLTGNTWSIQIPDDKTCTYECTGDFNIDIENKDKANTDPPKTTSDPNHWTITVLYITNGATGFILIVLIAVITIRRCRRRSSGEGHVDTSTQPQQLETGEGHVDTSTAQQQLETTNDELNIYEDPDDRNPENVSKRKLLRNTGLQQSHKAMRAEKENDTTPHMAMEAGKGKYTTPYMDMGPGIEEDTYMSTEGPIDVTTPSARGDTDTDQYMNPEALKKTTYLQLVEDTDEPLEDDN
ncbi:uncharacterized protein LOC141907533 [Tubulanus polymorphus]|uniref:uncharacterized protein LOC141907533 n=1 Tax=Tubulanus polymorphus TaxID=672921 RepID=UPI003DA42451